MVISGFSFASFIKLNFILKAKLGVVAMRTETTLRRNEC